ncbi:MAG: AAA family ATPase [Candidatus Woesearchaeota archaeon]
MRTICIINQKGGVGKTTTTVNLGAGLSRKNRRVLLLDLDPQGSVATSFNDSSHKNMYDFLIDNADIRECIRSLGTNFDMVTSNDSLVSAEAQIQKIDNKEILLRKKINDFKEVFMKYDYILIDCPPSKGILTQNGILAGSEAIIPTTCDYLSYHSTKEIIDFINHMAEKYDHDITVSKIVPTLFDLRCADSNEVLCQMKNDFYEIVADPIRSNSKIKEAPKYGQSIFKYAKLSNGAEDYQRLVNQVIYDERRFKITPKENADEEVDSECDSPGRKIIEDSKSAVSKAAAKASMKLKSKSKDGKNKRKVAKEKKSKTDDSDKGDSNIKSKVKTRSEAKAKTKSEAKAKTKSEAKAKTKSEAKAKTKSEAKAKTKSGAKAKTKSGAKAKIKSDKQSETTDQTSLSASTSQSKTKLSKLAEKSMIKKLSKKNKTSSKGLTTKPKSKNKTTRIKKYKLQKTSKGAIMAQFGGF